MAANSPEPSSSSESTHQHVSEETLQREVRSFCDVNYVNEDSGIGFQGGNFVNHFKADAALPTVVSYGHFTIDPCSSSVTYAQGSLPSYSSVSHVSTSNQDDFNEATDLEGSHDQEAFLSSEETKRNLQSVPNAQLLHSHQADALVSEVTSPSGSGNVLLHEDSVDSHHSQVQETEDPLERVALAVDPLNLQHVSIVHHGLSNLGSLPLIFDRNGIAALISTSRSDTPFTLDVSNLPRTLLSSQTLPQRTVAPDQSQFLNSDASISSMSHILSPLLTQKDILTSMMASSSSTSSSANSSIGSTFPINHKQMLAQKYAAEMLGPTTSASLINDFRDQQLIESMSDRTSSPYVVASNANSLLDSSAIAVYDDHSSSLASTSVSQCLPLDVYAIDRGVALVTSSRDSPENVINGNVEFDNVTNHGSSHHSVQNFVSSSVDLVHSHQLDHGMHCAVDSTVGPKLQGDENIVDSSDGYNHHLENSENVLHTTTGGDYCHISDMNSCEDTATNEAVTSVLSNSNALEANEALSTTNHGFASHNHFADDVHNSVEDLQSCATVSSATHPDSTRSPVGISGNSPDYSLPSTSLSSSPDIVHSEYSRPRRDLRSNRHWCEDCGMFYDKECSQHRIQLIFDKPVLSRAWASLPATYLYVNKIGIDEEGDPVYGVFAKKSIPKRTQFGPVEGILVKREDPPSDNFILLVEHDNAVALYLDTSDESMSNWMRFVRPADTHKEQNLVLVQQGQSLFFNTTRSINPKTELRVWYSPAYAQKWGLPVLEPNEEEKKALQEQENAWPCFECNQRFATSEDLQKHLNQHDEENEVTGSSRTRQKSKNRSKLTKKVHNSHLRNLCESNTTEGIIRKTRGRPPKKYKVSFGTLEETPMVSISKRPRGRPPKKIKIPCKQEDYKCDICYKSFPRNYSLQRHLIMHTGEKKYKCPICDIKFSHVYNRNRHVRRHKRDDDDLQSIKPMKSLFKKKQGTEWVCTHCGLTFDNSSVLNLHTLTHAAEDVAFNEGHPFLDSSLVTDDGFDGSDESKLGGEEMPKCPECTQEFSSRRDLIEHASVHGKIGKQRCYRGIINPLKPFKCNLCYKSFASDERLIRHYLVHGSEDSKPLQCDICYKRFLNNSALACHIKVHSEERKFYECPICKMEFDQIVALKEHVHIHCENGVYNCPNCHKVFEEYNQVRKHIRAFHSERRYPCDKCDKIFPRPDKLKLHMLRHSDHREFLCANCGKQFKRKDKLKEHMKRMHAPDREAKVNAKNSKSPGSKKFVPKVSPTDYHRFIYKCHTCLLGFKRRGMLVNHLAKRHPDIRPESVPELNLPILKTTRDYYCQYCEKVYKSSSKRKAHILKNHPGAELPMSNRRKGGVPEIPGMPNPTFSQTVGSITTHPHHCNWCHKQYASKAKLLQHQRKKHLDMLQLSYVANNTKVEPVCDQGTQVNGQIVIESISSNLSHEATAVLIDTGKRKIHYVDKDSLVVSSHPDGLPTADLLTQAMSELTQNLAEYRSTGEFLATRLSHSTPATLVNPSPSTTPIPTPESPSTAPSSSPPSVLDATIPTHLDQIQLNQLLAQYQQQQLSPQQLAVVVTSVSRSWPAAVTTSLSNYPAR
ncbi:PR domain zinc finger protein 10-like isoform X2 [Uloborus diversus]|uniref:PR domain zinc finger protein 10-like isoform X2 n=1 Tax=Uloborus diversus TaxID=327109 RepID=UPI0024091382|nr:PR domain zinc finger protein 10-like isoform X2 [Uloborus diversus]